MQEFETMENVVLSILKGTPETREDDYYLFYFVCLRVCNINLLDMPFHSVLLNHDTIGLPKWETVTRCRRKLQSKYPELANKKAKQERMKKQEDYITYAKS